MADEKPRNKRTGDEPQSDEANPKFERFEEFVKKIAAVPKEEVDEKRREWERDREKRAG